MQHSFIEDAFARLAPAGYYLALNLGFYAPQEELNTFPVAWVDHYTQAGLAPLDPLMRWCYGNSGFARWSAVCLPDPANALSAYRDHGMAFGAAISVPWVESRPRRSFGLFARSDREYLDSEMRELLGAVVLLHEKDRQSLSVAQAEALRLIAQGARQKEIAHVLGISISAVKARLRSASDRLGARTPAEAASIAAQNGLL